MQNDLARSLSNTLNETLFAIVNFLPRLVSGLIVLLVGIIIASFLKQVVIELFKFLKVDNFLKKYGVAGTKEGVNWTTFLAELIRWFVIIIFLVPVAEVWGLGRFVEILQGLLMFIPNVLIAVLLLMVGMVIARLVYELILGSIHGVSHEEAKTVATVGRWAVLISVFLIVLNQLGIASDLIRILFAGFVAMIALAGGLAFGLGGRDLAKDLLESMRKKV